MGDADDGIFEAELTREFTGGAYIVDHVQAGPPWIRLMVTPPHLEFRGRGLLRVLRLGPWTVPHEQARTVFAKQRRNSFPPIAWDIEIVTTDPSLWWTFWSPGRPEPILLAMQECGYPVDWVPHNWAGIPVN